MILLYLHTLPKLGDYLTDAGVLNLETTERFLEDLGSVEDQVFKNRLASKAKRDQEFDAARRGEIDVNELKGEDDDEDDKLKELKKEVGSQGGSPRGSRKGSPARKSQGG